MKKILYFEENTGDHSNIKIKGVIGKMITL